MRVYRRGQSTTWYIDITVDGERIKRSAGTTERAQAEEYAAQVASDLWRVKRLGQAPSVTWDAAVVAWLQEFGHRRSIEDIKLKLTWLTYQGGLQGVALKDIDAQRVRQIMAARRDCPVNRRAIEHAIAAGEKPPAAKPAAAGTVNLHMAELSKILHYAHKRGWIDRVPPITKQPQPAKRMTWLTPEQAEILLAELPAHLRQMARFALSTGLRETNVRMLTWTQVDMERGTAWIHADQAKAGKNIPVPLNADALNVLREQQGQHRRWVFPVYRRDTKTADAPTGKICNHAWRKACIRAGVPELRFHDLRHTWASWHTMAGTPAMVLKELGGWASLAMVERYTHLSPGHLAAWADRVSVSNLEQVPELGAESTQRDVGKSAQVQKKSLGWLMGLEPTTTGITILDSTN